MRRPEERGDRLAARLVSERVRAVQEKGSVLATLWTASNRYVRRLGWEAPAQVFSWTVPTTALKGSAAETVEVTHGDSAQLDGVRDGLAGRWNGPWQRPQWWGSWQQEQHPGLETYAFADHGRDPGGVLSVATKSTPDGRQLVVHDFWAADAMVADAMFAFLGRHHGRVATVLFERTGLPPGPLLQRRLAGVGAATARFWHPWMLRVLDPGRAVELRGWPVHVDDELVLDLSAPDDAGSCRYLLNVSAGSACLTPGGARRGRTADVTLTSGQFALWYAGGYRSPAAALAGIRGEDSAIGRLLATTADREPWLADYF
ncbi:sterol carrier protein domain-containing protein [Streptomyces sp. OspMP-M43]|uniref:GNAT family N-acetyltransferase n=1 Tax=Streptomyces sp. OspMP-M43 TaxID=1839781 RepID=UPI00081AF642|nr:sterol carrier protein domain-containing protein [Streptomyces sp. OspMP-M43]SCE53244.1 Predicted acetyltransferase [Streptomyces sp. OspMP-M43]